MTTFSRREFLAGCLSLCAAPAFAAAAAPRLVSAAKLGARDGAVLWSADGLTSFALPARGHAPLRLAGGRVLVMGRRPGPFATILDPRDPASSSSFVPAPGNRFAGHAALSPDGASLFTSEFDATSFRAAIVLRDPMTGAAHALWQPGGVEPHELVFAKGGARLVAALGGLIQDGGVAGPVFNPGGIDSTVLEIDPLSGKILARHKFGAASLSLPPNYEQYREQVESILAPLPNPRIARSVR